MSKVTILCELEKKSYQCKYTKAETCFIEEGA